MSTPPVSEDDLRAVVDAMRAHPTKQAAAEALGIPVTTFKNRLTAASRQGYAPGHFEHGVAPGYLMGKVTVQRSGDGSVERTWERQSPDAEAMRIAMADVAEAMAREIKPVKPTLGPEIANPDLLTLYTFTDLHLGSLAWHREGGADYDLKIAERTGIAAMSALVAGAPSSGMAIVNIQGDFLHTDGLVPTTPLSGHILDADSRFGKVVDVAIDMIRTLVSLALQKHEAVKLLICEGNHDISSSIWLRKMFGVLYANEPRLTVDDSDTPYYAHQHGQTMLAFHHGHLKKNDALPLLFAAQFPIIWGATVKRFAHTGHYHCSEEKEHAGMIVTRHPTLAARDAYASRNGFMSERAATAITYHRRFGRVATNSVCPEMLAA